MEIEIEIKAKLNKIIVKSNIFDKTYVGNLDINEGYFRAFINKKKSYLAHNSHFLYHMYSRAKEACRQILTRG